MLMLFFFFNDTATTEIYTLSLHDALPIFAHDTTARRTEAAATAQSELASGTPKADLQIAAPVLRGEDRKSTRLNYSHANISYAVFCLKKNRKHKAYRVTTRKVSMPYESKT